MLGPLGADVFIGLSEEEQKKRHIANVEAPSDKDVKPNQQEFLDLNSNQNKSSEIKG